MAAAGGVHCGWTIYGDPAPMAVALIEGRCGIYLAKPQVETFPRLSRPGIWQPDFIESDERPVLSVVYLARLVGRSSRGIDVANVGRFRREAILWRQIGLASIRRTLRDYVRRRQ